jgi:hypothetical protein
MNKKPTKKDVEEMIKKFYSFNEGNDNARVIIFIGDEIHEVNPIDFDMDEENAVVEMINFIYE